MTPQRLRSFAVFVSVVFAWGVSSEARAHEIGPQEAKSSVGRTIENFRLQDFRGKTWALSDFAEARVVAILFVGTECPIVKLYTSRLTAFQNKYRDRGVQLIAINSNQHDSLAELAHFARVHGLNFPLLKDPGNVVADQFGATRTPEVFVLDRDRRIRYQGRIDDQYTYGIQRPKVEQEYLVNAVDALLAERDVATPYAEAVGCLIGRVLQPKEGSDVTYSRQISRILQAKCVECHREGEIAPFALTEYDEVVGWAEMIAEVVREQRMPPWHANPEFGEFANDARLTNEEKDLIYRWVAAGAPQGDPSELPPQREFTTGWRIGKPDLVIPMADKPFSVPAEGEVKYQYFVVDPGFTEDKWIQAAECRPGNRSVVHHIIVAALPPGGRNQAHGELRSEWISATAPGARPLILPKGMAKRIPAGSRLVFQMHYTPNGTPQEDLSAVGFIFADPRTVKKEVVTQNAVNRHFRIPAGAPNHPVEATYTFSKDSLMLAMFPHMHLRGKSFRYTAQYPDGSQEILLDIPRYDFNWQNSYIFPTPKLMPAGTRLHCIAHFDNSEENLANPDPTKDVTWGDQTWEEMMIGYFDMVLADQDLTQKAAQKRRTEMFLDAFQKTDGKIDEELSSLARSALQSDDAFQKFAGRLRAVAPQLDRVCLSIVQNDQLVVTFAAQESTYKKLVGGKEVAVSSAGLALPTYAMQDAPTIHQDLAKATSPDLRFMRLAFSSSLHVPVRVKSQPATLNYWSAEKDAFPNAAVELLTELAKMMTAEH